MEFSIFSFLQQGGYIAISAFLVYLIVRFERVLQRIEKKVEALETELRTEYVKKSEVYSDISGWRGDLRALAEKIDSLREEFFYLKGRYDELKCKKEEK